MIELGSPLSGSLSLTPHGQYGAPRPLRNGTHRGLDFVANEGDPVLAVADGPVARTGTDPPVAQGGGGGGNYVIQTLTDGSDTIEAGYFHLSSVEVRQGQSLSQGDRVGGVGSTGTASGGAHLHFQLKRTTGGASDPIDPSSWFPGILWQSSPVVVALLVAAALWVFLS